ncbi:helix-turn-helix domain-containing protein [Bradyrhizobium sp.]|uniref:GlxA family transcriptional regulator n=1 Tax=Bradyrhizobium sp. TaxID=376 RepID=UPI001E114702|nr:helix-turn-helix domain-containing protein [Bradyrhizobium sp.]MBI5321995.1 helix-turn-helix domain-containing protein [Bradyrhizobium sp.]
MKLAVLLLEGSMESAVIGMADLLGLANFVMRRLGKETRFQLHTLSLDGKPVRTSRGLRFPVDAGLSNSSPYDAIIVPGRLSGAEPARSPARQFAPAAAWLRRQHARGCLIGAFCSGVFLLAESGLLENRRATTTWWLQEDLKDSFPTVDLAGDAVVTSDDRIVCAAGPMSWVDLLLRLIEMVDGPDAARTCADYAVVDTAERTQAVYMPLGYLQRRDPLLIRADVLVRRARKRPMTVRRLALELGLSERTLHRRFMELTGASPQAFILRRRIERSRLLLETTTQSIKAVARAVGYEDDSSFRRAFRTSTAMTPQAYRTRRAARLFPARPSPDIDNLGGSIR